MEIFFSLVAMSLLGSVWKFTSALVPVFSQVHFCLFSSLLWFFLPDFFTKGRCEKYLSKSVIKISESCSAPLPYAAAEKSQKLGFSYSKAYKSKTNPLFKGFFLIFLQGKHSCTSHLKINAVSLF
jgi:hypothetical protein